MNRDAMLPHAEKVVAALAPACHKIVIAGSVRREKPECKDLEIVAHPQWDLDMFGDPMEESTGLAQAVRCAIDAGLLEWDREVKRNGTRYKRFRLPQAGVALDLFLADEHNFGPILAIRTGCGEFSKALMYRARRCGMVQADGYLWVARNVTADSVERHGRISCPTEREYFDLLRVPWREPRDRTAEDAQVVWSLP